MGTKRDISTLVKGNRWFWGGKEGGRAGGKDVTAPGRGALGRPVLRVRDERYLTCYMAGQGAGVSSMAVCGRDSWRYPGGPLGEERGEASPLCACKMAPVVQMPACSCPLESSKLLHVCAGCPTGEAGAAMAGH